MIVTASVGQKWLGKTPWMPVADGCAVTAAIRTANVNGNVQVYLGSRLAVVQTDNPSSAVTHGAAIATATSTGRAVTLSAGAAMWAQFGYVYELSSGTAESRMLVGMDLSIHQCVEVVGTTRVSVPPALTAASSAGSTTEALVVPVGGFASRAGLVALKGGILSRSAINADMETMIVYRTGLTEQAPGAWQFNLEAAWDAVPTAAEERCTGQLAPTFGTDVLVQPGFAIRRKFGSTSQVRGDFEVSVLAVR